MMPPVLNTWQPLNGLMKLMFARNAVIQSIVKGKSSFRGVVLGADMMKALQGYDV